MTPPFRRVKSSVESLAARLKDSGEFLSKYIIRQEDNTGKINVPNNDEFYIKILMLLVSNQAAIMAYFLEREGYLGFTEDVKKSDKEEN